ncbi:MAG: acyl-CoA carboxylase subunit beta, partial [Cytophagaceae bacterium]
MNVEFNRNEDHLQQLTYQLRKRQDKVALGGGAKRIAAHKAKGKLTARERINYLLDQGAAQVEIGAFAGEGMYQEEGGCPGGGVVVVIGYVQGRQC